MQRSLIHRPAAVTGILGALVVLMIGPSSPWEAALGHPTSDMSDHIHGMWWVGQEILAGRWPDFSAQTHFPQGTPLWFPDPIGALMALALRPLGPTLAYNGVIALQLWAAGLAGWAMCRDLGASASGALLGGIFLLTSPYLLGLTHSGISEGLGLAWVALATWALLRAMGRAPEDPNPALKQAVWAGLALMLVGLQSPVYLVGVLILALVCALGPLRSIPQRTLRLSIILALAAPAMLWLRAQIERTLGPGNQVGGSIAPGWAPEGLPATDLMGFIRPGAHYFPDTPALGNPGVLHVHYIGWIALVAACVGWRRAPWLRLPTLVIAVMCMGPMLTINGAHLPSLESPFLLPLSLIYLEGSPLHFVHHPYRLVAVALPLIAVLLALGVSRLSPMWVGLIGLGMVGESLLISPAPWPIQSTHIEAPAVYADLPQGPVMDWPPDGTDYNRRYLRWQMTHQRPIAYGVNTTFPDAARHDPILWGAYFRLTDPSRPLKNRDIVGRRPKPSTRPATLAAQGFRALVFHGEALEAGDRQRTLNALHAAYGPPDVRDGATFGWAIDAP